MDTVTMGVGIVLAVLAAVAYNSAFVIQKVALSRLPDVHARRAVHLVRTLLGSPLWALGFALSLCGTGLQVLALSRAPLAVVQAVVAAGIVVLLVLSHTVLHEHLHRTEWLGIAGVSASLALIGGSLGSGAEQVGTEGSWARVLGAAVPTVMLGWVVVTVARRRQWGSAPALGLAAGLAYGVANLATKSLGLLVDEHGPAGAIPRAIVSPDLYLLGGFAAAGLLLFQTGLQRGRASVLVPISNVVSAAYPVAVGMALFGESLPRPAWRAAARLVGFAGVLAGTAALSASRAAVAAYSDDDAASPETTESTV